MTAPTKEQCVQWAREFGTTDIYGEFVIEEPNIHAFAIKLLAEKELEVVRLRELVDAALWNIKCVTCDPDGAVIMHGSDGDVLVLQNGLDLLDKLISTTPSTEALDEYVAARMAESEDRTKELEPKARRWEWIRYNCLSVNTIGTNTISADEKAIDTAIEAEKVRTE